MGVPDKVLANTKVSANTLQRHAAIGARKENKIPGKILSATPQRICGGESLNLPAPPSPKN
jgi:hypothetical protein